MPRKSVLCVILTTALACFFAFRLFSTFGQMEGLASQTLHPETPVLVLERDRWDFGGVTPGTTLVTHFPIKNTGHRRLIVRQQTSSCECVAGDRDTIILQPGESTEITASLDTEDLHGGYQMELNFTTSTPNLPKFKLTLLADVHRDQQSNETTE